MTKLMLGTVQFGLDYGISNKSGQTARDEVEKILKNAKENAVDYLDTARGYGESEQILGSLSELMTESKVVTKVSSLEGDLDKINTSFKHSLKDLRVESVHGLLLHDPSDLNDKSVQELVKLKEKGKVSKIGVSVYSLDEIDNALKFDDLDLIQVPMNILDQRLLKSNHLKKMKEKKIEIHVRSLFLQGLLFMNPGEVSSFFKPIQKQLTRLNEEAKKREISVLSILLGFAKSITEIDKFVVGVNTSEQFLQIIEALKEETTGINYGEYSCANENILNPAKWNNQ